jgi:hypothetical protein
MSWCTIKPVVDTSIDLSQYDVCQLGQQLKDRERLKDLCKRCNALCQPDAWSVQWQLIDATHYMFVLTEKATGQTLSWSVMKAFPNESAQAAFERDYIESTLRYNVSIMRALEDHLEALQDTNPTAHYRMECTATGYRIFRPIIVTLGLVPFQLDILTELGPVPLDRVTHPGLWEALAVVPGEAGRALARLVTRYMKLGVVFDTVEELTVQDYAKTTISGRIKRDNTTHYVVRLTRQDIQLTDPTLAQYHEYYTL